jgi:1-phosphofructokinase
MPPLSNTTVIVTVTPNPAIDLTYQLAGLRRGELNLALEVTTEGAGKGVNVAKILVELGHPARAVVTSGGATGGLLESLTGIDTVAVAVVAPTRTNVTIVEPDGTTTKVNEPGHPLSATEMAQLVEAAAAELSAGPTWLAVCGSLPPGTPSALVTDLVAVARRYGCRVAVDSSGPALAAAVDAGADLIAPNSAELAELTGHHINELHEAARSVAVRTGTAVLASAGAAGAVLATPHGLWHAVPPRIEPVNTTGAGDALLAAYLAHEGEDPERRLVEAVAVATSACLSPLTAGLPEVARRIDPNAVGITTILS